MSNEEEPGGADSNVRDQKKTEKRVYIVVLTGGKKLGPCGGKTTAQQRLATFFENLGWKVYLVPETATVIIKGGIDMRNLSVDQRVQLQEDFLLTTIRLEDAFFHLAKTNSTEEVQRNVLVICDRGTMDGAAYLEQSKWDEILERNNFNPIDLRDARYDQVVHLTTAAIGAEHCYTTANNAARTEDLKAARDLDKKTRGLPWVGHPYVDVIENKGVKNFDEKMLKLTQVVCDRAGITYGNRLEPDSRKKKYLISALIETQFPKKYEEFEIIQDYLMSQKNRDQQINVRNRGRGSKFIFTHTVQQLVKGDKVGRVEKNERRKNITETNYLEFLKHTDTLRTTIKKTRRCFIYEQIYFQLDTYEAPVPPGRKNLVILEYYTIDKAAKFFELAICENRKRNHSRLSILVLFFMFKRRYSLAFFLIRAY